GKIVLLGQMEKLEPKETAFCQIALTAPLLVMRGDRFIVRDETAQRTLGGGQIIHPWAQRHKRGEKDLQKRLESLAGDIGTELIEAFLDENTEFATSAKTTGEFLNLVESKTQEWIQKTTGVLKFTSESEEVYTTEKKWRNLKNSILSVLKEFHLGHPLAPGMDMEELRANLPFEIPTRLFRTLLDQLAGEKAVAREGNFVRLPAHKIQLQDAERSVTEKIKGVLGRSPLAPPDLKEIEKQVGLARGKLTEVIRVMEREGSIVRIATDLYFLSESVDRVKAVLYKYLSEHKEINAATFRDLLNSSRKFTIALLEHFDREGITIRIGDTRKLKSPPTR
ncbi:MAG: hypothetical protein GTO40_01725, partial [Deltaproteobacteria bacterium]|nr:hypothetical protein [Deltaproteobacteria bacterium]